MTKMLSYLFIAFSVISNSFSFSHNQKESIQNGASKDSLDYIIKKDSIGYGYNVKFSNSYLLNSHYKNVFSILNFKIDSLGKTKWFKIDVTKSNNRNSYSKNSTLLSSEFFNFEPTKYWKNYARIIKELRRTENFTVGVDKNLIEKHLNNLYELSRDKSVARGMYYQIKGLYQSKWLSRYKESIKNSLKARDIYRTNPGWYNNSELKGLDFNTGFSYVKINEYEKAIPFLKWNYLRDTTSLSQLETFKLLSECYKELGHPDRAYEYLDKMLSIKNRMNQNIIRKSKLEYQKKPKKPTQLAQSYFKTLKLIDRLLIIIPILIILIIMSVMSIIYLIKRHKKRSYYLKLEKSETLQKLDELKTLVIKNHITLKDKTKVYISELMFIKSDDHYLNIFTSNDKSHFVRGKLGQIKEELPPNFIQCHRSFIVNSNFIKQINQSNIVLINSEIIPLSRSFRKGFNNNS